MKAAKLSSSSATARHFSSRGLLIVPVKTERRIVT